MEGLSDEGKYSEVGREKKGRERERKLMKEKKGEELGEREGGGGGECGRERWRLRVSERCN